MHQALPTSWQERLAIINEFKLPNDAAVQLFNTTERELQTARGLVEKGMIVVNTLSTEQREQYSSLVTTISPPPSQPRSSAVSVVNDEKSPKLIKREQSSTANKQPIKGQSRRGRQGNKIVTALAAIPTTPQPIDAFINQYGVSKTVLRQSRRFLDQPIKVSIKRDKTTGIEMIYRV